MFTPEEVVEKIQDVTLKDVHEIAKEVLGNKEFSLSTIGPLDKPIDLKKYYALV